jgi:hypothetical protein
MNPTDQMATNIEPTKRQATGPVASSGDVLHKFDERFRALKDLQQTSAQPAEDLPIAGRPSKPVTARLHFVFCAEPGGLSFGASETGQGDEVQDKSSIS